MLATIHPEVNLNSCRRETLVFLICAGEIPLFYFHWREFIFSLRGKFFFLELALERYWFFFGEKPFKIYAGGHVHALANRKLSMC